MRYLLTLLLMILVVSCQSNNHNTPRISALTVREDSAKLARNKEKELYFAHLATTMGLVPINNGVDSFELRLWVSSMAEVSDVYVFAYKSKHWKSHHVAYFIDKNSGMTGSKEEKIKTSFTATRLADSLMVIDFTKLFSQEEIPNFEDHSADGVSYHLEIATKNSYKQLNYHNPQLFANTEVINGKFVSIINLLNRHFNTIMILPAG